MRTFETQEAYEAYIEWREELAKDERIDKLSAQSTESTSREVCQARGRPSPIGKVAFDALKTTTAAASSIGPTAQVLLCHCGRKATLSSTGRPLFVRNGVARCYFCMCAILNDPITSEFERFSGR